MNDQPRRILIFGGTFDPPHRAHAALPVMAAELLDCDLILFVPAAISPLKTAQPCADPEHRLAMLLLAIADVSNAKISTIELDRAASAGAGPSYTIDTLRALHDEYSHAQKLQTAAVHTDPPQAPSPKPQDFPEFRLLIGCDQALDFHRWKDWQQILLLATPAVMLRPPWNEQSFHSALMEKHSNVEAESWMEWTLRLPIMDISATEVRRRLTAGEYEALTDALDPAVLNYIRANNLYRNSGAD
jgi:nicotinate-nucleotide adenylyltransferase